VPQLHRVLRVAAIMFVAPAGCSSDDDDTASAAGRESRDDADQGAGRGGKGSAHGGSGDASPGGAGGSQDPEHPDSAAAAGSSANTDADAGASEPGTFSHVYDNVFVGCRRMCHSEGLVGLDMSTRQSAYRTLVDQPANPKAQCADLGKKRVQPGAPDDSLLFLKLNAHAPCGQQMPPGGQLPMELRDEVKKWIEDGAKDN
jgi:hypothetical protein